MLLCETPPPVLSLNFFFIAVSLPQMINTAEVNDVRENASAIYSLYTVHFCDNHSLLLMNLCLVFLLTVIGR